MKPNPPPPFLLSRVLAFIVRWRYQLPIYIPVALLATALLFGGLLIRCLAGAFLGMAVWVVCAPPSEQPRVSKFSRNICHNRFHPNKLPEDLDVIVIGSGLSGLSCAAVLARTGKKVAVLEQHEVAGGGTHAFELGKGFRFDSGLHYVPPWSEGLLQIVTDDSTAPVAFDPLGETPNGCFDRVVLDDGTSLDIRADEAHLEELAARFPHESAALARFHHIAHVVMLSFPLFVISKCLPKNTAKAFRRMCLGPWRRWGGRTSRDVMEEIFEDKNLAALICGQWQDTGTRPDTGIFWLTASVFRGLAMEGASYPRGGSEEIAKALVASIERHGGVVLVRCPVEQICVSEGCVTGVQLQGKHSETFIECGTVVSSAGYFETMGDGAGFRGMLTGCTPKAATAVNQLACSDGFTMCNVCIDGGTAEELGLTPANVWYQPCGGKGVFQMCEDFFDAPDDHAAPMMLTFPSMKDSAWTSVPENQTRHTAQILILTKNEWFQDTNGAFDKEDLLSNKAPSRSDEYTQYKKRWSVDSIQVLRKLFPKLDLLVEQGKVTLTPDVSTPLTIQHYLAKSRGQATGLDSPPERFTDEAIAEELDMKTEIEGLWLTGQDTFLCGQPLVQIAGVVTALRMSSAATAGRFVLQALRHIFYRLARV